MGRIKKQYIILTGGDGGFGNLGDEWLLESVKKRYKRIKKHYRVVILMTYPPKYDLSGFYYCADNLSAFKSKNIEPKDVAALHFYGGGYINSFWIKDKLWVYNYLKQAGLPDDKVFFTGVGLGPLDTKEASYVGNIARSVAFFGKRDNSFRKEIGGVLTFDESIFLSTEKKNANKRDELWVNFRIANHVGIDETRLKDIVEDINNFSISRGLKIRFFSMIKGVNFDERSEMIKLLRAWGMDDKVKKRPKNHEALMRQFNNAALVVTTSYHACLASLYKKIPVAAVYNNEYYDYKYNGLGAVLNSAIFNVVNVNKYDKAIWEKIIDSRDSTIGRKIKGLKNINDKAYNRYEDFLNA